MADPAFPQSGLRRWATIAHHGEGQWNGVAVISRVGLDEVRPGFDDGGQIPIRMRGSSGRPVAACGWRVVTYPMDERSITTTTAKVGLASRLSTTWRPIPIPPLIRWWW
ncbi:MAG: hypothetical protein Ct9H300mP12_02140 [Acidimicrobiales bacterium]|nr:MAG: hypothetical protein Ct9H300mP12_02140 [Acidimicrobiales bacterium]